MSHQYKFLLSLTAILLTVSGNAFAKAHFLPDYREKPMIFFADDTAPDFPHHNGGGSNNDNNDTDGTETDGGERCPPYLLTEADCREAGQIPDTSAPTCSDDQGMHYTSCRCGSEYGSCGSNAYGDPDTACTDSGGTKYKNCLCDHARFPKSEADCREDMGPNAKLFLTLCHEKINGVTTIYGNSCGCSPSCPPSHPYQSCGDKTIVDKVSDGCINYCYKCL